MDYQTKGEHVLVDAWGVDFHKLNDLAWLTHVMRIGAEKAGATIVSFQRKQFTPNGVTIILLLSESHFSIHTYPEKGFAGIDCYTCGDTVTPMVAVSELLEFLKPAKTNLMTVSRGVEGGIK